LKLPQWTYQGERWASFPHYNKLDLNSYMRIAAELYREMLVALTGFIKLDIVPEGIALTYNF
jgi:hypothetical protein